MGDRVRSSTPGAGKSVSVYITSHPGQLSLAIPLWVGAVSTIERGVMRAAASWGVKASMVREWVTGKIVLSLCCHVAISAHL